MISLEVSSQHSHSADFSLPLWLTVDSLLRELYDNQLTGTIPAELGALTSLTRMCVTTTLAYFKAFDINIMDNWNGCNTYKLSFGVQHMRIVVLLMRNNSLHHCECCNGCVHHSLSRCPWALLSCVGDACLVHDAHVLNLELFRRDMLNDGGMYGLLGMHVAISLARAMIADGWYCLTKCSLSAVKFLSKSQNDSSMR